MIRWLPALALVFVLAWIVHPLLLPHQVAGHSAYVDLSRSEAFHQAVRGGDLTPRWLPDFYYRYGSPIFNFYAPLTYYVIETFRFIGLSGMWALKLTYLLFWLMASFYMWRLAGEVIDRDGAYAAAAAYLAAPYLLIDAYVRVGIAEFAAFAWLPMILLGLWRSARETSAFGPLLAALAFAGLMLTHNITAMIATPLLLFFALVVALDWKAALKSLSSLLLGMTLAAFFWVPAIIEKKFVHATESLTGGFFDFHHHFLAPKQLFVRFWGYGASKPGLDDGMGFMYGELLWLAVLIAVPSCLLLRVRRETINIRVRVAAFFAAAICLLMTLPVSKWLWESLPLIHFVQFPWRFLLPATAFGALLVAALPMLVGERIRRLVVLALVLLALGASVQYLQVRYVYHDVKNNTFAFVMANQLKQVQYEPDLVRPDHFLTIERIRQLGVTSTAAHDYLPFACTRPPEALPANAVEASGGNLEILSSSWGYPFVRAETQALIQEDVIINQFYFPGWQVTIDDAPGVIRVEPETGRMLVAVGPGRHALKVEFKDSPTRLLGKLISLFGMAIFGIWLWVAFVSRNYYAT